MSKNIDLFKKLDTGAGKPKKAGINTGTFIFIMILVALVIALGAVTGLFIMDKNNIESQIAPVMSYVEDPDILALQAELLALQAQADNDNAFVSLTETVRSLKADGLMFDKQTYQTVLANMPQRVTLTDIAYSSNTLTLNCTTVDNMPPSDFAENLDTCGYFSSVQYTGFTQSGDGQVVFTIVCM